MSDLLHPPSLARTLKDAAARNASSAAVADPDADAAATRAALEACEKAATILQAQLAPAVDSSDANGAPPPPALLPRPLFLSPPPPASATTILPDSNSDRLAGALVGMAGLAAGAHPPRAVRGLRGQLTC